MSYAPHGLAGSLPSDYAILSRFSHPSEAALAEDDSSQDRTETDRDDHDCHRRRIPRRLSFPSAYIKPLQPSMGPFPSRPGALNENTPLLTPAPVLPRISEYFGENGADSHESMMSMFWEETGVLARYTLPVFASHLLEYSIVIVSVISIGHISTAALAAITLGSMTANVSGLSVVQGLVLLGSLGIIAVVTAVSLIPTFFIWFNSEAILLFLKQDPEVAHYAALYLKWVSLGLPAYAFNAISRRYFQSQGLFTIPTRIIMAVAPINVFLNYLLVWGPKPIRLGFIGAPIATAISFNLIALMSVTYGVFFVPSTAWCPISRRSFTSLGVLVQLGMAGVGQIASEWWSWELVGLAASFLGPVPLAAQSVLLVSASTSYQAPYALSASAAVRIGNLLGESNAQRARVASNTSLILGLVLSAVWSTVYLIFRDKWAFIFNNDPEVVALVSKILPLVALFQVFDATCGVAAGILRARGKQFTGALLNLSAYYIIGIPFGLWLTFKRDVGLAGLWYGLTVALIYCALIGSWLCVKTDWNREVKKVQDRLAEEQKHQHRSDVETHGRDVDY